MKRFAISCLLLITAAASAFAGEQAPPWLQQALSLPVPAYDKDITAVVLVNETTATVSSDGRVVRSRNYAVRLLQREGRAEARGTVGYVPDAQKVKDFNAWVVRADGTVKRYGKDQVLDVAAAPNDVYNEYRLRVISAEEEADAGAVFGYSYSLEDRSVFSQDDWLFQDSNPTLTSRYTLILPAGWRAESVTFNHPKIEPKVNGSTFTWELGNLPAVKREPLSPSLSNLVARLAVSYYPPGGVAAPGIKTFANWNEVAAWMSDLEDPQVTLSEPMIAKVKDLTANAKTEYQKIQAIGHFVQKIQYISIQTGLGRGGGYRPHSAAEVFAKAYGDCKDKANLMRAMLKVVGITAFPVSIYASDPAYVRPEWPSPQQFNHCIIAVKITEETSVPTVIEHPRLGRLLIFDPTAEETPVGDLPSYLQGSLALIDSRESDSLVEMPSTPPDMNHLESNAELQLQQDGSIRGEIQERARGQIAARFRMQFRSLARAEYTGMIERWLTSTAPGSKVTTVEPVDEATEGRFALKVAFASPQYGQVMQDRLLVFKPAVVSRRESATLTESKRKHPVVLPSNAYSETIRVRLPEGFEVDELPEGIKMETAFGAYSTSYELQPQHLIFKRTLVQKAMTVPVDQYSSVRNFLNRINASEQAPVVLVKK